MPCPYSRMFRCCQMFLYPPINDDDAMYVIGHDHKFVQFHAIEMLGNRVPTLLHNLTPPVQPYYAIQDIAENTFSIVGTNRHKIDAVLRVIIIA